MRWVAPLGEYDLKTGPHEIAEIEALTRERWEGPGLGLRRRLRPHKSPGATPWLFHRAVSSEKQKGPAQARGIEDKETERL